MEKKNKTRELHIRLTNWEYKEIEAVASKHRLPVSAAARLIIFNSFQKERGKRTKGIG